MSKKHILWFVAAMLVMAFITYQRVEGGTEEKIARTILQIIIWSACFFVFWVLFGPLTPPVTQKSLSVDECTALGRKRLENVNLRLRNLCLPEVVTYFESAPQGYREMFLWQDSSGQRNEYAIADLQAISSIERWVSRQENLPRPTKGYGGTKSGV